MSDSLDQFISRLPSCNNVSSLESKCSFSIVHTRGGKEDHLYSDMCVLHAYSAILVGQILKQKTNPFPLGLAVSRDDGQACDWGGHI